MTQKGRNAYYFSIEINAAIERILVLPKGFNANRSLSPVSKKSASLSLHKARMKLSFGSLHTETSEVTSTNSIYRDKANNISSMALSPKCFANFGFDVDS